MTILKKIYIHIFNNHTQYLKSTQNVVEMNKLKLNIIILKLIIFLFLSHLTAFVQKKKNS